MSKLDDMKDFFYKSYALTHVIRYSTKAVIKPENVATHSFFVALGVLLLHEVYEFNVDEAIKKALCHDLPESEISDVNHYVKRKYPAIAQAMKDAESQVIEEYPKHLQKWCHIGHESTEDLIVHLADALSCTQYATSEIDMGNDGYMREVFVNSRGRVAVLEDKLEAYKREN